MKVIEESERSKRKKREREFVVVVVVVVQPNANGPFVCIRIDDLAFSPTVRPPAAQPGSRAHADGGAAPSFWNSGVIKTLMAAAIYPVALRARSAVGSVRDPCLVDSLWEWLSAEVAMHRFLSRNSLLFWNAPIPHLMRV